MKWWQDTLKDKETQKLNLNLTCTFKTSEAGWPYFINIFFVLLLLLVVYQIKNTSKYSESYQYICNHFPTTSSILVAQSYALFC